MASVIVMLVLIAFAGAGRLVEARLASMATARQDPFFSDQQQPGDTSAVLDPLQDIVGSVADDVSQAASEVQDVASSVVDPVVKDPKGTLVKSVHQAEQAVQDVSGGQDVVSDVLQPGKLPTIAPSALSSATAPPPAHPAPYGGVYCRGGACKYRMQLPGGTTLPPAFRPLTVADRELCRGLSCMPRAGWPLNPAKTAFEQKCFHLFQVVGGGMQGQDRSRKISDVRQSFYKLCHDRVEFHEVIFCGDYADVFVAALSPFVHGRTVGRVDSVCSAAFNFIALFKQAEVDLKFVAAALPKSNSLLALGNSGIPQVGPNSTRGLLWCKQLSLIRGPAAKDKEGCPGGTNGVVHADVKYKVAPGSADGKMLPTEISGNLFAYCGAQMDEITGGTRQSAALAVQMVRDWCTWQSVPPTSQNGAMGEAPEHPEWNSRSCTGMAQLLAFSLRRELGERRTWAPQTICKRVFRAVGSVHAVARIVANAGSVSIAGLPPVGPAQPDANDAEIKMLMREANIRRRALIGDLEQQQQAMAALKAAKEAVANHKDAGDVTNLLAAQTLPDSADFDFGPSTSQKRSLRLQR
mmetsp:Transcript_12554/g.24519  ORF Transcript_12554/g.24519 Transcript_12554/m.24519 type:complete len:579 (+) Transcript_12554:104-1840(+)